MSCINCSKDFEKYISQRAVLYTSEAQAESWAEENGDDEDHDYAFDSGFWHSGGAGW